MEWFYVLGISVIPAFFSVLSAYLLVNKSRESILEEFQTTLTALNSQFKEELEPIITTNKRAMGIISAKSVDARQLKKAESLLSEGILSQNQLLLSGIEAISPQLAEHLTENPDTLLGLLPRLEAILSKTGIDLGQNPLSPSPATSSPHPFGRNEE